MAGLLFSSLRTSTSCALISARGMHSGVTKLYIGADMPLFFVDPKTKTAAEKLAISEVEKSDLNDPFKGVAMRRWADYLGDRFFPTAEELKADEVERKKAAKNQPIMEAPEIPSLLPFTHWAAKSEKFKETLVVDESTRVKPRLSWYHPDDTLVPRDWFSKGLLEDIKYYRPFC
ncbi:hypothetical protein BSKO_00098 [Bryopsis sp. KO-2023]|nr:hypothetical protein BSKO_00098 [Bryopsis sp. KO-2023]